jgi:hypothetical protein
VRLLLVLGTVGMAAGAAGTLHLSPLVVCTVAGATLVNARRREATVFPILQRSEFTLYVLFLVLVGCRIQTGAAALLPVAAAYLAVRLLGKTAGGAMLARSAVPGRRVSNIGLAMLPQGGMTVALAVDFARLIPAALANLLITVVIIAVFASGLFSRTLARRVVGAESGGGHAQ